MCLFAQTFGRSSGTAGQIWCVFSRRCETLCPFTWPLAEREFTRAVLKFKREKFCKSSAQSLCAEIRYGLSLRQNWAFGCDVRNSKQILQNVRKETKRILYRKIRSQKSNHFISESKTFERKLKDQRDNQRVQGDERRVFCASQLQARFPKSVGRYLK